MNNEQTSLENYGFDEGPTGQPRRNLWPLIVTLGLCPLLLASFGMLLQKRPDGSKLLAIEQAKPTPIPVLPSPVLVQLDKAVQSRFAVLPAAGDFGIRRMMSVEPVTETEKNALRALDKSSLQVAFYTAGRTLALSNSGSDKATIRHYIGVRGPVTLGLDTQIMRNAHGSYVTGASPASQRSSTRLSSGQRLALASSQSPPADAPKVREISQHLSGTLENVRVEAQSWKSGRWEIAAIPVQASSPACVTCHNALLTPRNVKSDFPQLKLGDTIGYAIYASAPKEQTKTKP